MPNTEAYDFMSTIIEHAQSKRFTEFHFIHNWSEYRFYKGKYRTFKFLIKALLKSSNKLFRSYCDEVINGTANFTRLLAYNQMQHVIAFYQQEVATLCNMIYEYEAYLTAGNFLYAFLGGGRADEHLVDFRDWR